MKSEDVVNFYTLFSKNGIVLWLDGGWAVDALLGMQTRDHSDMDIVIQQKDVPKLRELLENRGFMDIPRDDTSKWNFVLGDKTGRLIDVHAVVFDKSGNVHYGPIEKELTYTTSSLTGVGAINNQPVKCISAEYLLKFHTGYKLDENDYKDVKALCEKFGIEYPQEYVHLKTSKNKNI